MTGALPTASLSAAWLLDFEPQIADSQFGPERSLRWMLRRFYERHLTAEHAATVIATYEEQLAQAIESRKGEE